MPIQSAAKCHLFQSSFFHMERWSNIWVDKCGLSNCLLPRVMDWLSGYNFQGDDLCKNCHVFRTSSIMSKVKISNNNFIFIALDPSIISLPTRITEITLSVELTNSPWLFCTNTVDCTNVVLVCNSVRGLLEFPKVFTQVPRLLQMD